MPVVSAPQQYPTWTAQLLQGIGAPVTPVNQQALVLWTGSEGTLQGNNPLAITTRQPGATSILATNNGDPIYAYDTLDDGIAANAAFLKTSDPGIVNAFKAPNATLGSIWTAINQSSWCKGCQSGKYPVQMFAALSSVQQAGALVGEDVQKAGGSSSSSSSSSSAPCSPVGPNLPVVGQIFTTCSVDKIVGITLIGAGGLILFVGLALVAASMGTGRGLRAAEALPGPAGTTARVAGGQGRQVGAERRSRATRAQAQSDALERTSMRGANTRRNAVRYDETPF
jgi:hypothetical protein